MGFKKGGKSIKNKTQKGKKKEKTKKRNKREGTEDQGSVT
jgi:hypothetical protein